MRLVEVVSNRRIVVRHDPGLLKLRDSLGQPADGRQVRNYSNTDLLRFLCTAGRKNVKVFRPI